MSGDVNEWPDAILSAEEIAGALVKIAPDEPWPLVNGDWFTRLCVSHEALRAEVERLTKERAIPGRFSAEVAALHERAEAAESRVAELIEARKQDEQQMADLLDSIFENVEVDDEDDTTAVRYVRHLESRVAELEAALREWLRYEDEYPAIPEAYDADEWAWINAAISTTRALLGVQETEVTR